MGAAVTKVADEDLSLKNLGMFASEEIEEYQMLMRQARRSATEATLAIFRAGKWLSLARKKIKAEGRGKWTAFLKEYRIPRTTEWEARTLYKRAKTEAAVKKMTPTEAKRKYKVVPPKKKTTSEPTVHSVKADRATAGSIKDDGTSLPMTPRRFGEPPSDPDRDRRQAIIAPSRPKPSPERCPTPADRESDVVG
jgi:hypothetical protein